MCFLTVGMGVVGMGRGLWGHRGVFGDMTATSASRDVSEGDGWRPLVSRRDTEALDSVMERTQWLCGVAPGNQSSVTSSTSRIWNPDLRKSQNFVPQKDLCTPKKPLFLRNSEISFKKAFSFLKKQPFFLKKRPFFPKKHIFPPKSTSSSSKHQFYSKKPNYCEENNTFFPTKDFSQKNIS